MNGAVGIVVGARDSKQENRYPIQLEGKQVPYLLKGNNLLLLSNFDEDPKHDTTHDITERSLIGYQLHGQLIQKAIMFKRTEEMTTASIQSKMM